MKSCNTVIEEKYDPFAIEQAINSYLEALKYFAERVSTKEDKLMHELMVFNHKYILTNLSWIPHGFEIQNQGTRFLCLRYTGQKGIRIARA